MCPKECCPRCVSLHVFIVQSPHRKAGPESNGIFPKQWYTEGFWRLGKDIHECTGSSLAPVARQLLSAGCGLGEGQVALVHAKRSRAPLSTEKHISFGTISFRSSSGPPLAQMPPKCVRNVSQMSPRCLPDASQMPLRCLSDASQMPPNASQMPPDASQKKLFGVSRWGNLWIVIRPLTGGMFVFLNEFVDPSDGI